MNASATPTHIVCCFVCVFVVEAQATLEQAKVHEAEITQGEADEATGGVGRPEGEGIDQAFSAFLDTRSISFSSSCYALLQFAHRNLPTYLAGAMNASATPTHIFWLFYVCLWLKHRPQ